MTHRNWIIVSCGTLAFGSAVVAYAQNNARNAGNRDISAIHSIGVGNAGMQIGQGRGNIGNQGQGTASSLPAIIVPPVAASGPPGQLKSAGTAAISASPGNSGSAPGQLKSVGSPEFSASPGNSGSAHANSGPQGQGNAFGSRNDRADSSPPGLSGSKIRELPLQSNSPNVTPDKDSARAASDGPAAPGLSKGNEKSSGQSKGESETNTQAEARQSEVVNATQAIGSSAVRRPTPLPLCN
jgi:hypothetical protein